MNGISGPGKDVLKAYFDTLYLSPIVFRATMTTAASQTISPDTSTDLTIDTENLDPQGIHSSGEVTPGFVGVFNFRCHIWITAGLTAGTVCYFELWSKPNSGGSYSLHTQVPFTPALSSGTFDFNEYINVDTTTRVFKMRLYLQGTGDKTVSGSSYTSISGMRVA